MQEVQRGPEYPIHYTKLLTEHAGRVPELVEHEVVTMNKEDCPRVTLTKGVSHMRLNAVVNKPSHLCSLTRVAAPEQDLKVKHKS